MTWEEFKRMATPVYENAKYVPTEIECPDCGKPVYRDTTLVYTSLPPQYRYVCLKCGWSGIHF